MSQGAPVYRDDVTDYGASPPVSIAPRRNGKTTALPQKFVQVLHPHDSITNYLVRHHVPQPYAVMVTDGEGHTLRDMALEFGPDWVQVGMAHNTAGYTWPLYVTVMEWRWQAP